MSTKKMINARSIFILVILAFTATMGCRKKDGVNNPCDGLVNEAPPFSVFLKVTATGTGENLLTNGRFRDSDIAIIDQATNTERKNWKVVNTGSATSPYYGTLQLVLPDETEGQHTYLIKLGSSEQATLQYTVSKKQTNDPCRPVAYSRNNIKLTDRSFELMTVDGTALPNFLIIKI